MWGLRRPTPALPDPADCLPGRATPVVTADRHHVLGAPLRPPFPAGTARAFFAMGCFWGAERKFWTLPGVVTTAVGYAGGTTPNPLYEEVCSGMTDHTEIVLVAYDPAVLPYDGLLATFWENHDPTQAMRQGNDVGTQYRSMVMTTDPAQALAAHASAESYGAALSGAGYGPVATEIRDETPFYYAEAYHQQYLAKNPGGYCGLGGTGVPAVQPAPGNAI